MDAPPEKEFLLYQEMLKNVVASEVPYTSLNENTMVYFKHTASTVVYMSICLTCSLWQLLTAIELVYRVRKWIHFAVLSETLLSFLVILCSVLNPLTSLNCEIRFWISIVFINLGGCCIQSILLYKAYICYDRARWLIIFGSLINLGYIGLIIVFSTMAKLPTYKDIMGNLEWPALAKLGLDIASNVFLSIAFLMVIYRHYRVFGNSLHKTLLSNGIIFSVGVIASNIVTAILISCRVMGGLSADLYSFDWVITSYLLIKQFNYKQNKSEDSNNRQDQEDEEQDISRTMEQSFTNPRFDFYPTHQTGANACQIDSINSRARSPSRFSSGVLSASTTIKPSDDIQPKIVL
ncbi:hypothetical protein A0J61_02226 [Choanephora cucurbitarum]|uniref:Uncharacterized protein n=1 Tax=Choanephora cucurbitarum TaxID=101091 RepID=A0A1C7NKX4_9FUNG|nr:hypothetical protein A0J61_02226 [Choanephora cucurbitarum]